MSSLPTANLFLRVAVFFVAIWPAAGCAGKKAEPEPDTVSGTVRFNGNIVNYGSVAFYDANGRQVKSIIRLDGAYSIRNPPQGEVKVVVRTGPPPPAMASPAGDNSKPTKIEQIDIPAQYSDPEKTNLHFTVTPGKHQFDINLESEKTKKP
ncbi:MAG: hypothetical protein ACJ8FY_10610 [Gemmataceae bacterium]